MASTRIGDASSCRCCAGSSAGTATVERGSRRNIAAHYDLGNDFFELVLDPTMTYSCGYFETDDSTLEQASIAKYDRICRKLDLEPDDHVIEIGTGWGGFAVHAARRYGCRVTTTTISEQQLEFARERVRALGLEGRIELLSSDYRDLEGDYDKLVSIEMIEAVGLEFLDRYFSCCSDLLRPGGVMALQAIIIDERFFERARRSVDFIQRYIFPGSAIPSLAAMERSIRTASELDIVDVEDITTHYPPTLRGWRERLRENVERIRALGYSQVFERMFEFYLSYCEGGFLERSIGDVQVTLKKQRALSLDPPIVA